MKWNNVIAYKGYHASIRFDAEDEVLWGEILGIDDLISFEADSAKKIKAEFRKAVEDYFVTCKELGKEPQQPRL
jgi:predicted HicB family RNase H-like nuclease